MVMIRVNIHEAKARLSWCLERVVAGDEVLICRHNRPVAALRAIREQPRRPRQLGHARGRLVVPSSFFDVLPEEELVPFDEASRELCADERRARGTEAETHDPPSVGVAKNLQDP